jgi:hypothetical protein
MDLDRPNIEFEEALLGGVFELDTGETMRIEKGDGTTQIELDHGCLWIYQAGDLFGRMLKPGEALVLKRPTVICALERSSLQRRAPGHPWPPGVLQRCLKFFLRIQFAERKPG